MREPFSTKHAEEKIILLQWLSSPGMGCASVCHIFRHKKSGPQANAVQLRLSGIFILWL
jgi:hypothetical protein